MTDREEFIKRIRSTFKLEAAEGIEKIGLALIKLEKSPGDEQFTSLVESIYREAHSLKGASRAVNFSEVESICQVVESVFSRVKDKSIDLEKKIYDLLHYTVNILNTLLTEFDGTISLELQQKVSNLVLDLSLVESGQAEKIDSKDFGLSEDDTVASNTEVSHENVEEKAAETLEKSKDSVDEPGIKKQKAENGLTVENVTEDIQEPSGSTVEINKMGNSAKSDTIRISIEKLDDLLFKAEEMLSLKQIFGFLDSSMLKSTHKLKTLNNDFLDSVNSLKHIKEQVEEIPPSPAIRQIFQEVSLLSQNFESTLQDMKMLKASLNAIRKKIVQEEFTSASNTEALLSEVKKIIAVPISTILDTFPKAVRDMASDKGKMIELEIEGGAIELDRRILEQIRHPLIHMLRNSIDHGIESSEERKILGKPEQGTILIKVERMENNQVEIRIRDDGRGVDYEKIRAKYSKQEGVSEAEVSQLSETALLEYVFRSGISTSDMITDLSGRGLGLAIVKEKIEQIGGSVSVNSEKNKGTEFCLQLPLSLVTFRGLSIEVENQHFVLPTSKVLKVIIIDKKNVKSIEQKKTIQFQGNHIPFVYLADVLEIPRKESESDQITVVILCVNNDCIALAVNQIINEEILLVKYFNKQLTRVRNISGATILETGKVVPILHVADILKSSMKSEIHKVGTVKSIDTERKRSILVVEDSITSRMLLKNILETSGYTVTTAVDGVEGYTFLREGEYDLIVSDVDMPRMSGLDMTAKIRSDKDFADVPIVLVTSLSKREDRERGMEVGANAYIVKSSFDQSNLLEVVDHLI